MKISKFVTIITTISLLNACCSSRSEIPEKNTASTALQITRSAGSLSAFKDRDAPKGLDTEQTISGATGTIALGTILGSMTLGFGLVFLGSGNGRWEYTNYIMYLDASKYGELNKEEACPVVLKNMETTMPQEKDALQKLTTEPLNQTLTEKRYNGGSRVCTKGFKVSSNKEAKGKLHFRDEPYLGTWINVKSVSEPFSTSIFNNNLKKQIPFENAIAVRFNYAASTVYEQQQLGYKLNGKIGVNGIVVSPFIKLPKATFISLPEKQYVYKKHYLRYISGVRNNDTLYYFVKPQNGKQYSIPLVKYHQYMSDKISNITVKK